MLTPSMSAASGAVDDHVIMRLPPESRQMPTRYHLDTRCLGIFLGMKERS